MVKGMHGVWLATAKVYFLQNNTKNACNARICTTTTKLAGYVDDATYIRIVKLLKLRTFYFCDTITLVSCIITLVL